MKYLTPEILRKAADIIARGEQEFSCIAVYAAAQRQGYRAQEAEAEAYALLFKPWESGQPLRAANMWPLRTTDQKQGARFMYLHLLALAVEDGLL